MAAARLQGAWSNILAASKAAAQSGIQPGRVCHEVADSFSGESAVAAALVGIRVDDQAVFGGRKSRSIDRANQRPSL